VKAACWGLRCSPETLDRITTVIEAAEHGRPTTLQRVEADPPRPAA
jgi:hypothetical protein